MLRIAAILFSVLMLSVSMQEMTMYTLFRANQTNVTDAFCENRELPELNCYGSCYLNKTLSDFNSHNQSNPIQIEVDWEQTRYMPHSTLDLRQTAYTENIMQPKRAAVPLSQPYLREIFHPPKQA